MKDTRTIEEFAELISAPPNDAIEKAWHVAVEKAAANALDRGELKVVPLGKASHAQKYKIAPRVSWKHSAEEIRLIINGYGSFYFESLREFLDSGPYTPKQAVLSHLHWVVDAYDEVYGDMSPEQMFEHYFDLGMQRL